MDCGGFSFLTWRTVCIFAEKHGAGALTASGSPSEQETEDDGDDEETLLVLERVQADIQNECMFAEDKTGRMH